MQLSHKPVGALACKRASPTATALTVQPRASGVACRATAAPETAWAAWDTYMSKRHVNVLDPDRKEKVFFTEIGTQISKQAVGYKPKYSLPHETTSSGFKLQHLEKAKIVIKELPKDLHDKLEAIGVATLKGALSLEDELDYANASYTTTDIEGAVSITGTTVQKGSDKSAVVVFVATETERQASWSRLEGLILHWACTASPGGAWSMPPDGWTAAPKKTKDAGGAWQCSFEKQIMANNEQIYVLVMQLPLKGALKSGGMVFVLKGTLSQTDRWLKDGSTDKDFFLDLQKLPITKI